MRAIIISIHEEERINPGKMYIDYLTEEVQKKHMEPYQAEGIIERRKWLNERHLDKDDTTG